MCAGVAVGEVCFDFTSTGRVSGAVVGTQGSWSTSILPLEFSPPNFQFPIPLILPFQCLGQFGVNWENIIVKIPGNSHILKCFVLLQQGRV